MTLAIFDVTHTVLTFKLEQLAKARDNLDALLWGKQLGEYPDSIRLSFDDISKEIDELAKTGMIHQIALYRLVLQAIQYPTGVFYKCGKQPDGSYRWRGFRYGFRGNEYIS